jgi:hypothetical protein
MALRLDRLAEGVAFVVYAAASPDFAWFVCSAIGLMGIQLLLFWLLERIEVRRGEKLVRLGKALLPLIFPYFPDRCYLQRVVSFG